MQNLQIPIAIIIAGAIVASAIIFTGGNSGPVAQGTANHGGAMQGGDNFGNNNSAGASNVAPVTSSDHVFGNPDAKVTIVEYSDFECPFCARFHPTLERVVEDFGGEVKWVYRHFPLSSIHPGAIEAALASECVAELGGNDAFWSFSDEIFKNQRGLSRDFYTQNAAALGIAESAFTECLDSRRHQERVQEDLDNAVASGGRGTPFSVVINEEGEAFPFSGALPYENVRSVVEQALGS